MELISGLPKNPSLTVPLLASLLMHSLAILLISTVTRHGGTAFQPPIPIQLIEMPRVENETSIRKEKKAPAIENPQSLALHRVENTKEMTPVVKTETMPPERPAVRPREEPAIAAETKSETTSKSESVPRYGPTTPVERGGSEAGARNLFGKGDVGVVSGSGAAGGGGGTAASGLGRGSGAPGFPPEQPVLRTNREAKPIQTVRASYPPMALRMGMESDVTLRIEVDPEGKVTRAEITKGGGAGFDDEALKAVKQSRFEPAQRDGHNIRAEFTYIYRFRLQR